MAFGQSGSTRSGAGAAPSPGAPGADCLPTTSASRSIDVSKPCAVYSVCVPFTHFIRCPLFFYDFNIIGFVMILCIRSAAIKNLMYTLVFAFLYLIDRRTQCLSTLMPKLTKQGNKKETEACTYMNAWACIIYSNAHILLHSLSLSLSLSPHILSQSPTVSKPSDLSVELT